MTELELIFKYGSTHDIMRAMEAEFGDEYLLKLADLYLSGMDTETAVYKCYNELKCKKND